MELTLWERICHRLLGRTLRDRARGDQDLTDALVKSHRPIMPEVYLRRRSCPLRRRSSSVGSSSPPSSYPASASSRSSKAPPIRPRRRLASSGSTGMRTSSMRPNPATVAPSSPTASSPGREGPRTTRFRDDGSRRPVRLLPWECALYDELERQGHREVPPVGKRSTRRRCPPPTPPLNASSVPLR